MGTFRSRRADHGPDGQLGGADALHPDDTGLIPPTTAVAADATVVIAIRWQRPVDYDSRALLPVWLFRLLVGSVFTVLYALIAFGLFLIVMILVS